jgi:type IV secretory pathway VirB10-like protein
VELQLTIDVAATAGTEEAAKAPAPALADLGDRWKFEDEESGPRWNDPRSIWLAWWRVAASALAHVLAILWVAGVFATAQGDTLTEAIPVVLVPPDATPPPPPPPPPKPAASGPAKPATADPQPKPQSAPAPSPQPPANGEKPADATSPPAPTQSASAPAKPQDSPGIGGEDRPTTLTEEEREGLIAQVRRCWHVPAGWTDPRQVSATVRFRLNRDGTLDGKPVVVEFHASKLGKDAADDAVRALAQCGPYKMPADKYAEWSDVQMRFVP